MTRYQVLELVSFVVPVAVWLGFHLVLKRNVLGDMIAGFVVGCFVELFTASYWNYHFAITVYKDLPLCVLLGWGMMFALGAYVSELLYRWWTKRSQIAPDDPRVLVTDILGGLVIVVPAEVVSLRSGIYEYNYSVLEWTPHQVPVLDLPYMAFVCYAFLLVIGLTFVRTWRNRFGGRP
jgi:hypothetical protein